ncbi:hepatitis A virus cellular receptor 1 homolog [Genypterus blacodes]|uniref:hepatitis A virus cellular receptor 1 homolog n=1 Tax=Genypterus blacodes TaxID=154954 RepID=UPI003F76B053
MRGLCCFFFSVLTQVCSGVSTVTAVIGHNVTLPCRYDTHAHGMLEVCWGRGKVPRSKCSDTILSSWDGAVQFRESLRYQLEGGLTEGDVSLTILHARRSDAGAYGCRVEIPGWFNDLKVDIELDIEEAPMGPLVTESYLLPTAERLEIQTTSTSETVEPDDPAMAFVISEKISSSFLEMENIGRMAALLLLSIIIILIFIYSGRRSGSSRTHREADTENVYETVNMPH